MTRTDKAEVFVFGTLMIFGLPILILVTHLAR